MGSSPILVAVCVIWLTNHLPCCLLWEQRPRNTGGPCREGDRWVGSALRDAASLRGSRSLVRVSLTSCVALGSRPYSPTLRMVGTPSCLASITLRAAEDQSAATLRTEPSTPRAPLPCPALGIRHFACRALRAQQGEASPWAYRSLYSHRAERALTPGRRQERDRDGLKLRSS